MPWSFGGSSGGGGKAGRGKQTTKRKQQTQPYRRPRNFGRSLVNAAVREMMAEERAAAAPAKATNKPASKPKPPVVRLASAKKVAPATAPAPMGR